MRWQSKSLYLTLFSLAMKAEKKRWLCILLWCVIATFLSVSVGTKFGYTLKMLQEVALIYLFCVFLYQSRWDRRLFIVVTVYSVLFSYSHWFDELCMRISGFTYEEYIWNVPLYSIFFFLRCSFILAFALGQFTRNYTQTTKRGLLTTNKAEYQAPGKCEIFSLFCCPGFQRGTLWHTTCLQSVVCYTLCRRCCENEVAAREGKGI